MDATVAEPALPSVIETTADNSRLRRYLNDTWVWICRASKTAWIRTFITIYDLPCATESWLGKLPPVVWFEKKYPGWQAGVVLGIAMAIVIFVLNLLFLIFAAQTHWGSDGLGTLLEGDCDVINKWNKNAHIVINVMSTCLLMQSNYCMQLLASPTRLNVDVAHRKREWVDIGIQSFRNVWKRHISPWRGLYWVMLAASSIPLHLLWNSVIIFSPSAYQYNQLTVSEGFVQDMNFTYGGYLGIGDSDTPGAMWPDNLRILQRELKGYQNLTNAECKREYAQSFVRNRSDVIVVTKAKTTENNMSTIWGASSGGWGPWPYRWLCPKEEVQSFKCYDQIRRSGDQWTFPNSESLEVLYCLSKPVETRCKLQYGFWIAFFTVGANFLKVVCFCLTLHIIRLHTKNEEGAGIQGKHGSRLLITTGDAIASFLEYPDNETLGMSIVARKDFTNGIWEFRWIGVGPMIWRQRFECSWFRAVGVRRWLCGIIPLAILALVPSFFLLSKLTWLIHDVGLTRAAIKQLGMGNPNGLFLFGSRTTYDEFLSGRILGKVALANTPQLAVSISYYLWNDHLTAMIAAREYDLYAAPPRSMDGNVGLAGRRSLRVTNAVKNSEQKSTRFLTVPLRYWVPNVVIWTLLHYLASQAVFFARVDILDHWLEVTQWSISQAGYSVMGLLYFLGCAYFVFGYALTISLRRLPNRMPLAATCSAAISAACHPQDPTIDHHERKVQWGVEFTNEEWLMGRPEDEKRLMRCTFTSGEAYYPELGRGYA